MSKELIERLRRDSHPVSQIIPTCNEAADTIEHQADEIERLKLDLAAQKAEWSKAYDIGVTAKHQVERQAALLKQCRDVFSKTHGFLTVLTFHLEIEPEGTTIKVRIGSGEFVDVNLEKVLHNGNEALRQIEAYKRGEA